MSSPTVYQITITATGEVRDADGNLISSNPVEAVTTVSAEQARALGLIEGSAE